MFINTTNLAEYPLARADVEAAVGVDVIWSDEHPPAPYAPVAFVTRPVPGDGENVVEGTPELSGGAWRQTWSVEASPDAPRRLIPKSVIQERVNDIGKLEAVLAALQSQAILYARWFAPDWPNVYYNDAAMLYLLDAVGCTAPEITAITAPV